MCPCVVFAAAWNDPDVALAQSISDHRYRDGRTGQFVSTAGMTAAATTPTTPKAPYETPTATVKPTTPKAPYETPTATVKPATTGGTTGTTGTTATAGGTGTAGAADAATSAKKVTAGNVAKGAGAALGTAVGGYMIYESTKGNQQHNVGNLMGGVMGGVTAGAAIGTAVGSPGIGTAIGAVVGGAIAGSQLFSETDCLTDPETKLYTCCNTVFNKGERQAKIGDYMFCADEPGKTMFIGGVRKCLQGKSETELSWWKGLWENDHWSVKCDPRYCDGEIAPSAGMEPFIDADPDKTNFCWRWKCKDGYVRSGDTCIDTTTGTVPVNQYEEAIKKINTLKQQLISECGNL